MFSSNWIFSKEFESFASDSFYFVLAFQPSKKTLEHLRYIMDGYELNEEEELCLQSFIHVLNDVDNNVYPESVSVKSIEKYLLLAPVDVYLQTFKRLQKTFNDLAEADKNNVPSGYVSGYKSIEETLDLIIGFFYDLRKCVRKEMERVIEDAFGSVPTSPGIDPADIFESYSEEDIQDIDPQSQEFEFNPIY